VAVVSGQEGPLVLLLVEERMHLEEDRAYSAKLPFLSIPGYPPTFVRVVGGSTRQNLAGGG